MAVYRKLAEKIVETYDFNWIHNIKMREVCVCSVENVIANIFNLCIVIFITTTLGIFSEAIVFICTFAVMRCYSGGAHAKRYITCISIYLCILIVSIFSAKYIADMHDTKIISMICILSLVITATINYLYAAKQTFLDKRKKIYRIKTCRFFITICVLMFIMYILKIYTRNPILTHIILIQTFALLAQSITLLVGKKECEEVV